MQIEHHSYLIDFFHIDNDPPHYWLRKNLYKSGAGMHDAIAILQEDYTEKIQVMEVTQLEDEE